MFAIVIRLRVSNNYNDLYTHSSTFLFCFQVPFEQRTDGKKSDDTRMVHGGFFASAKVNLYIHTVSKRMVGKSDYPEIDESLHRKR